MQSKEIRLTSISPVAYLLAKVGELASVRRVMPKKNEYREKIGAAQEAILIFKGQTKIGMIPREALGQVGEASIGKVCRIVRMDRSQDLIVIDVNPTRVKKD
jgi:hypothetical protein